MLYAKHHVHTSDRKIGLVDGTVNATQLRWVANAINRSGRRVAVPAALCFERSIVGKGSAPQLRHAADVHGRIAAVGAPWPIIHHGAADAWR